MDILLMNFLRQYWYYVILTVITGYLLGSISFSIIVTRFFKKNEDIRNLGSHNAGFTNVLRSVGILPAVLTAAGDFCKCIIAIWISQQLFCSTELGGRYNFYIMQYMAYLAGFFCIIGHIYPCFFKLRGGKAVLTSFAMALMLDWRIGLIAFSVFLLVVVISKIISLASVTAAITYPIINFFVLFLFDYKYGSISFSYIMMSTILSILFAFIIIYKHSSNIERILSGSEKKITFKKS